VPPVGDPDLLGRKHRLADGTIVGSRVVFGGRAWRIPIIETVQRMQMLSMPIDVSVQGAYTKVGIPLKVRAIAVIKLSSDPSVVMNAIERFLGRGLGTSSRSRRRRWKATCAACSRR
jgi:flotillin